MVIYKKKNKAKQKIHIDTEETNEPHNCDCDFGHEHLLQFGKNNSELYDIVKDIRNNVILSDEQIYYLKSLNKCELLKIIKLSNFCNYILQSQLLPITPPPPIYSLKI